MQSVTLSQAIIWGRWWGGTHSGSVQPCCKDFSGKFPTSHICRECEHRKSQGLGGGSVGLLDQGESTVLEIKMVQMIWNHAGSAAQRGTGFVPAPEHRGSWAPCQGPSTTKDTSSTLERSIPYQCPRSLEEKSSSSMLHTVFKLGCAAFRWFL